MALDVSTRFSPGWWTKRLFGTLGNTQRQARLNLLYDYRRGNCPLPVGAENAREAFEAFVRTARSNFAELIVAAVSERLQPVGFRTALDDDETGDREVGDLWERMGLDVESANVHDLTLSLSEGYVIVGPVDDETGAPVVTGEDPRWMVAEVDPAQPRKLRAALKVLHDDAYGEDRAYLYLPGSATNSGKAEVWVSRRQAAGPSVMWIAPSQQGPLVTFSADAWEWDQERSGELPHARIPVVRFSNKDCLGEYEAHLDLLQRINQGILDRLVIANLQAFRQRWISGLPKTFPAGHPQAGQDIDYSDVFTAHPAAIWQLPPDTTIGEAGQVDLSGILKSVQDDIQHLAAVTRTPMHWLMPAGDNQSAEGASSQREGLVFKTQDRIARMSHPWAQVMSLALLEAGMSDRADLAKLRTIWAPPERLSLQERSSAASLLAAVVPRRSLYVNILGASPAEADRMMSELADDQLLAAQVAAASGANQQPAPGPKPATPAPTGVGTSSAADTGGPLVPAGQP